MKKYILLAFFIPFLGNAQFKKLVKQAKQKVTTTTNSKTATSSLDIGAALKEALNNGVTQEVTKLTAIDGFYKNEAVKILMPEELQKVDKALRKMGMSKLADDGIKALNRAAEDAVKESTPIFVDAIKNITIADAKSILLGNQDAATSYLESSTRNPLYAKFNPV